MQPFEGLCCSDISAVRISAMPVDHIGDCRLSICALQLGGYFRGDHLGLLGSRRLPRIDQLIPIRVTLSLAEARHLDG
jgi:hypothetical protein